MGIVVTESWSRTTYNKNINGWTAQIGYDVSGTKNEADAANDPGLPAINSTHRYNALLRCDGIHPDRPGVNFFRFIASYVFSNGPLQNSAAGLLDPPRVSWQDGVTMEPLEKDLDGNPIINSAGDTFNPAPRDEIITEFFTYTRNEPYFDLQTARKYRKSVNSDTVNITGVGLFKPGELKICKISPVGDYAVIVGNDQIPFIKVSYQCEIRTGKVITLPTVGDVSNGFLLRILDQGKNGVYLDGTTYKTDQIFSPDLSSPVPDNVRLNGKGAPLLRTYKVGKSGHERANQDPPKGAVLDPPQVNGQAVGDGVFLQYKTLTFQPFAPLGFL